MEAIQRGARAIDRILDGIGFYWEMNECDDWGGGDDGSLINLQRKR